MRFARPYTLDKLRSVEFYPNPVIVAGYGRESTHKGYLTWILDSNRWDGAIETLKKISNLASENELDSIDWDAISNLSTKWEQRLGKRKVDLALYGKK